MKPRILFVNHAGVLGGGELSLLDIARHYRDTSRVLLFQDGPFRARLEEEGIGTEVLEMARSVDQIKREGGLLNDLQALPGLTKLVREVARRARQYDLVYANSQKSMLVSAAAGRLTRRPVVWHLRDLMSADHFSLMHRRLAVHTANTLVDRVIANSNATKAAFVASGGRSQKVHVVYNGIDPAPFDEAADSNPCRLREKLGLGGVPLVGVFSRLAAWKGQHVLLDALTTLPGVHVLLAGDALFAVDQPYADMLHRMAETPPLKGRVHFVGFRHDVPELIRAVDIVAHTSISPEPFGRVIVEGMLAAKPVVATRAGGAAEIIECEREGLLVPVGDADALAGAIEGLLADTARAVSLGRQAAVAARERFSVGPMLDSINGHVKEVLERR